MLVEEGKADAPLERKKGRLDCGVKKAAGGGKSIFLSEQNR